MALKTGQPVGHLCDLLGVKRHRPGVFDAMVALVSGDSEQARKARDEGARRNRLADLGRRLTRRR